MKEGDALRFLQKVRFVFSNNFDDMVQKFLIGDDVVNIPAGAITTTTAMKYTAVFACLRVLGETYANVPALLYRKKDDGDREARNDLAIYEILHNKPNDEMSPFNFKEACMMALNTGGNSVCERLVDRRGRLVGLYPYQWQQVTIDRDENKKLRYKIQGKNESKTLTRGEVFHIPGPSMDGINGLSPIEYATSAIRLGQSYEQFGVNLYKNAAMSSGAFKFPHAIKETAFQRLKKELKENYVGLQQTGTPMILEDGAEFQPFTIKPADAQLIENKKFQIEDIARIYRVPLHLIQNLDRSTNNNIEKQSLEFVMYTMLPWFKRSEENVNMQLLTPAERKAGFYIEYKLDGLLRGDAASRARAYALGRQWGWLSVNDIRRLENLSPIPNGDRYLEPTNMTEAGQDQKIEAMTKEIYKMVSERM